MSQDNRKIKDFLHEIRSKMSVLQALFDSPVTSESENPDFKQLFEMSQTNYREIVNLMREMSNELYGTEPFGTGPCGQIQTAPQIIADDTDNILVIDDDVEIRKQFSREMTKRGKNVVLLEKGEELLMRPLNLNDFATVVVDYQFENSALDGFDIVEYLKSQKVRRIHLCTGCYDNPAVIKRAQELGIVSIISKPIPRHLWDVL